MSTHAVLCRKILSPMGGNENKLNNADDMLRLFQRIGDSSAAVLFHGNDPADLLLIPGSDRHIDKIAHFQLRIARSVVERFAAGIECDAAIGVGRAVVADRVILPRLQIVPAISGGDLFVAFIVFIFEKSYHFKSPTWLASNTGNSISLFI